MYSFKLPAVNEYMKDLKKLFKSKDFISFKSAMDKIASLNNGDKEIFIVYIKGGPLDKDTPIEGFLSNSLDVDNYERIWTDNYIRVDRSVLKLNVYKLKETK